MPYHYIHPERKRLLPIIHETEPRPGHIAGLVGMGARTVRRALRNNHIYGDVIPPPKGQVGRPRACNGLDEFFLEGLIERRSDATLAELRADLRDGMGIDLDESTIRRILRRRGFTRKQVSRIARERNEEKRTNYQALIGDLYPAETLVFLDESHCDRRTTQRRWGWAPEGDRAFRRDFFIRGTKYSILPAICLDGVLHLDIITRSWNAAEFEQYIRTLLDNMNPYPQRNSVLVMDNASTHHFDEIRDIVESRGMRLVYLPGYSPDLNPIEEGFSAMKAWLRCNRDYALLELAGDEGVDPFGLLWEAVFTTMTPESIAGWYSDSGYVA